MRRFSIVICVVVTLTVTALRANSPSVLRSSNSTITNRFGRAVWVEVRGNVFMETPSRAFSSGVIASFGVSTITGVALLGVHSEEGLSLYIGSLDEPASEWRRVAPGIVGAQWSPDGKRFLYTDSDGALILADPAGGSERIATDIVGASFSPDGKTIAFVKTIAAGTGLLRERSAHEADEWGGTKGQVPNSTGLYLWDVATRKTELVSAHASRDLWYLGYAPVWSPDGKKIVFFGKREDEGSFPLWLAELNPPSARPIRAVTRPPDPGTPLYWSADGTRLYFGAQLLEGDDEVWSLLLTDNAVLPELVAYGRPVVQLGEQLVIDDVNGPYALNTATGQISSSLRSETFGEVPEVQYDRPVGAEASKKPIYAIKYCKPLVSPKETAWVGHTLGPVCGYGGEGGYKFDCKPNPHSSPHKGTDFGAPAGTSIYAGASGTVTKVRKGCSQPSKCNLDNTCNDRAGNYVEVTHDNGAVTRYLHMRNSPVVKEAASVTTKTVLGSVGCTGKSSGNHLHFEIKLDGAFYDPYHGSCSCTSELLWKSSGCSR